MTDNVSRRIYAANDWRVGVTVRDNPEPSRPGYLCTKPGCNRLSYSGPSTLCATCSPGKTHSIDWWLKYVNKHDSGVPGRAEVM